MKLSKLVQRLLVPVALSLLFLTSAPAQSNDGQQSTAPFKVLLIESQGRDFPFVETLHDAFREKLLESKPNTQIYTEFLEALRLVGSDRTPAFANLIASYKQLDLDALVFRGPEAYEFGLAHPSLLPQVPHFASTDTPVDMKARQTTTVSPYLFSPEQSLAEIVRLLNPEQIFLLGSETAGTSAKALKVFQAAAEDLELSAKLSPMFAASLQEMDRLVSNAPAGSAFLLSPFLFANDRSLTPREITKELAQVANAPLFVTHSTLMGTGAIGGSLFSAAASGAALAQTVLGLEQSGSTQTLMYDGEALQRWGITPSQLQTDTVLSKPYPPLTKISKVVILGDLLVAPSRTQGIIDGFVAAERASDSSIDYVVINSGAARLNENPDSASLKAQLDSIVGYDAVVTTWVNELRFVTQQLPDKFVINLGPAIAAIDASEGTTGQVVNIGHDLPERTLRTAQLALQLPQRNATATLLLGDLANDAAVMQMLETQILNAGFEKVNFVREQEPDELIEQLQALKPDDTVFFLPFSYLPTNLNVETRDFAAYLAKHTEAPLLTMHAAFVGRGVVGGHVFQPDIAGAQAFASIQDINTNNIAKDSYPASRTVIDQQAFENFGGLVSELPAGAKVINSTERMTLNKWLEQNATSLLIALALLLAISLLYMRERSQRIRFNKLNEQLSRTAETQKEMFAVVGHELRTPVATISMVIDDQDQSQADKLLTVKQISENLLSVLEDLRTVVDPNRAKEVQYRTSQPAEVVQRALTPLSQIIRDRGIALNYQHNLQPGQLYHYREQALRQLVTNLVKNATVHSGGTRIWVSLETSSETDTESMMKLVVADDGKGIPTEQIGRMFSRFVRGSESVDGAGLGLYISNELAHALGGELKYDQREGGGASFSLEFTLRRAATEQPKTDKPSNSLQGSRVLFAEDDLTLRMLTEKMLTNLGAQVDSYTNGRLALDAYADGQYDLVLTDLMMPQMDGRALIRELRARGATVPIIAVTAAVVGKETEQLLSEGANGVISKPINSEKLLELLAQTA